VKLVESMHQQFQRTCLDAVGLYSLELAGNLILESYPRFPSTATYGHYKYKSWLTPDLLSRSFPHREVTEYWIVRVSFPLLGSIYNFSQL
jgi:hypothetical protein